MLTYSFMSANSLIHGWMVVYLFIYHLYVTVYWPAPALSSPGVSVSLACGKKKIKKDNTQRTGERLTFTSEPLCLTSCFLNESQLPPQHQHSPPHQHEKTWKLELLNMSRFLCTPWAVLACSSALQSMVPVIIRGGNERLALEHTHRMKNCTFVM